MKEIVVISGKGGTGKTSLAASFAFLGGKEVVVADCDVDAADMHLLLQPDVRQSEDFYSGQIARIDQELCTQCGRCAEVCRFDAIPFENEKYEVVPLDCEGCGYCSIICPEEAITMEDQNVGKWNISGTRAGNILVHARLSIGAENSGKLVAKVKNEAKKIAASENVPWILVDGSPGVGCPVVSSLSGAHFVILVTEPTVSGLHDLKRVYQLVKKFNIPAGCVINKYDLNLEKTEEILSFLKEKEIAHLASLPYDETFIKAISRGQTIVEYDDGNLRKLVVESWEKVKRILN